MIPEWVYTPQMIVTYVLFVLAALVSLYTAEIRRFIRSAGQTPRAMMINRLKYRKRFLEDVHDNPYNLLLFLAWMLVNTIMVAIWMLLILAVLKLVFKLDWSFYSVFGGLIVGRVMNVASHVNWLYNYEEQIAWIDKELVRLKGQSASPAV
jgi:hypothetical protein